MAIIAKNPSFDGDAASFDAREVSLVAVVTSILAAETSASGVEGYHPYRIGLKYTQGFSRLWPSIGTAAFMVVSVAMIGWAMRTLPVGTAYAVWTGIGAVGTVVLGVILFDDPVNPLRVISIALIIAGILGLNAGGVNHHCSTGGVMQAGIAKRMFGRTPREALACVATLVLIAGCKSADQSTVVPLTLRDNAAFVVVDIDGDKVPLQLDTGNSESITLTKDAMARVKALPIGGTSRGMDAKGNLLEAPRFKIPRLQIGTADFFDVVAALDVHHPTYPANEIGQQGFLGTALFEPYQVLFDYPQRTMTLMSSGAGCEGTAVPFTPGWNGQPVTVMDTDLGELVVWWDTGAPVSILSKRFVQKTSQPSADKVISKRLTLGGADFGPWSFEVWDVSLPPGFDGFIGNDFFADHTVCMDFPKDRLLVRKSTNH